MKKEERKNADLDEALNIADFNPLVRQAYLETKTIEALKKSVKFMEKIW